MNILFLCTGNTCRSPMAEAIALSLMREDGGFSNAAVTSAGLAAFDGDGATPHSVSVCAKHGLDISGHRSKALTYELVEASDYIYTMTLDQATRLRDLCPNEAERIWPLLADQDVSDPYGKSEDVYEATYEQIEAGVRLRMKEWKEKERMNNENCIRL